MMVTNEDAVREALPESVMDELAESGYTKVIWKFRNINKQINYLHNTMAQHINVMARLNIAVETQ